MIDDSSSCTLTAGLLLAGGVLPCAWGLRPLLPIFPIRLARTGGSLEPSFEPEEPPEAAASADSMLFSSILHSYNTTEKICHQRAASDTSKWKKKKWKGKAYDKVIGHLTSSSGMRRGGMGSYGSGSGSWALSGTLQRGETNHVCPFKAPQDISNPI